MNPLTDPLSKIDNKLHQCRTGDDVDFKLAAELIDSLMPVLSRLEMQNFSKKVR